MTTPKKTRKKKTTEEKPVEAQAQAQPTATATAQPAQQHPREVLLQVFEQGARSSDDWEQSQTRIQCIYALQQAENLSDIPVELKKEINLVMGSLLKSGQLHFGLQQMLYPMVKELQ